MSPNSFDALILYADDLPQGLRSRWAIEAISNDDLPPGEVLVRVDHSSLNYKDGLAVTGKGRIVCSFPMVPGIDLAGTVLESSSPRFTPGQSVLATGWGLGEKAWGGYAQRARLPAAWLQPIPPPLDSRRAMVLGTAGLTAMLCVMTLEQAEVRPESGTVLVSGASGGVGSLAVALLARLGYEVAAVTGRPENGHYLQNLGASQVIPRAELGAAGGPLGHQRWAGAVDTVGGAPLANLLAQIRYRGCVAACGLAGGTQLHTTVLPFILRGVSLRGVDSVQCPIALRASAWQRLADTLPMELLNEIAQTITLDQVPHYAQAILAGQVRGRVVVDLGEAK